MSVGPVTDEKGQFYRSCYWWKFCSNSQFFNVITAISLITFMLLLWSWSVNFSWNRIRFDATKCIAYLTMKCKYVVSLIGNGWPWHVGMCLIFEHDIVTKPLVRNRFSSNSLATQNQIGAQLDRSFIWKARLTADPQVRTVFHNMDNCLSTPNHPQCICHTTAVRSSVTKGHFFNLIFKQVKKLKLMFDHILLYQGTWNTFKICLLLGNSWFPLNHW